MAKTVIVDEGWDRVIIQSRLGFLKRRTLKLMKRQDGLFILSLTWDVELNKKTLSPFDQKQLLLGDVVKLPLGGRIIITEEVLQGKLPEIIE
jgi:hypothetical protein